jgi:hypothetical protein
MSDMKEIAQEQKRPTMMVATPMYGGMCTGHYLNGILSLSKRMADLRVPLYYGYLINESLITRARNELARLFLEKGLDYLMFIDADIQFTGQDVAALMAADRDIVCGIYPKKEVDWDRVNRAAKDGETNLQDFAGAFVMNFNSGQPSAESDSDGVIEVRHGGTGFMLIKRRVFEILKDRVPTYRTSTVKDANGEYLKPLTHEFFATSIDSTGALLSEDYHFCELWKKYGGKIYANPFIKLSHVGTYVYSGDLIKSGGNLK